MKITLATIKKFIRKQQAESNLWIRTSSTFDGRVDCVMPIEGAQFKRAEQEISDNKYTLGIRGVWFVLDSRDYFEPYKDGYFEGFEISNCCGTFILAKAINLPY